MTQLAKSFWGLPRRYFRIGLALVCVALAGIAFALHMTNMVTADAVLDGRRIVVRTQIDGRVLDGAPKVGDVVARYDLAETFTRRIGRCAAAGGRGRVIPDSASRRRAVGADY